MNTYIRHKYEYDDSQGLFITGMGVLDSLSDPLPARFLEGEHIILQSLANTRCSSDEKAVTQFTGHPRIPKNASRVALGHESVQRVAFAPPSSPVKEGDIVLITPGHTSTSFDPDRLEEDPQGAVCALGYSYRYLGGLRQKSAVPMKLLSLVKNQGFGELFNIVRCSSGVSLATLAHAEPFGCCANATNHMFYRDTSGEFRYGIPPRARIALLGGTARMALITLSICATRTPEELPALVAITGSTAKLEELTNTKLLTTLRSAGVRVVLLERAAEDTRQRLIDSGPFDAVFTNYATAEVYDQATAIVAPGGNINNFAGASDSDLSFNVGIPSVAPFPSLADEAKAHIGAMHHPVSATAPQRLAGIAQSARIGFVGFTPERLSPYLRLLPAGSEVEVDGLRIEALASAHPELILTARLSSYTDLFLAGNGAESAHAYSERELRLARGAAVNFVDGGVTVPVRSKHIHYVSRHQLCGPTVRFSFTNTSEPISTDMARQGTHPVDFDWLVRGVSGLSSALDLYQDVASQRPFGSFVVFSELDNFPYVRVGAEAFRQKATELLHGGAPPQVISALRAASVVLTRNGDVWSREVEDVLYAAYGKPHPLAGEEHGADPELVRRIVQGDGDAFAELVRRYQLLLYTIAVRTIGDAHLAEDIVQETFLRTFLRLSTLKDPQRVRPWLCQAAYRIAIDFARRGAADPVETEANLGVRLL